MNILLLPAITRKDIVRRGRIRASCSARPLASDRWPSNPWIAVARRRVLTLALVAAGSLLLSVSAFAQAVDSTLWGANNYVSAIVRHGTTIYIGGGFTRVGPVTGSGVPLNAVGGSVKKPFPKVTGGPGWVLAAVPDGAGGWYIGGLFSTVGGLPRSNVARILADGSVADWNPNASGQVEALTVSGSSVYVGGSFTSIGGQARNSIAAVDAVTGAATSWNPVVNGSVLTLAVSGSTVYIGGSFTSVGGQTRNRIAALSAATGVATSWNPNANGPIYTLMVSGSTVYVGGSFTNVGGQMRNRIAALSTATGSATSWNPNANGEVNVVTLGTGVLYAGGSFANIGGQARNHVAALSTATGTATSWNPSANSPVYTLAVSGGTVYAGGLFTSIGGQGRNHIAALDATTGTATAWNPNADNIVQTLAESGGTVYAGGRFVIMGGEARNRIAALDATTGAATAWNPNAVDGDITALAVSGGTVYAAGYFTNIGGQARNNIAALDAATGAATAWNPNANSGVEALAVSGGKVYAGGDFFSIGGQVRPRIAALDTMSGAATGWIPNANGTVYALAVSESTVYAAGDFTSIGGQGRNRIAALDAATAAAKAWNPDANNSVYDLATSGGIIYAAGDFTTIGGQARNRIAALDAGTGTATAWNPDANSRVEDVAASGATVYAGGWFTSIGGQARNYLAALDATTGMPAAWNPNPDVDITAVAVSGVTVYAGGWFASVGGGVHQGVVAINASPALTEIAPARGGNNGAVTATVSGSGLPSGATIKLTRSGEPDIAGTGVAVAADGTSLTASFDLTGAQTGAWDVVATTPDAQTATLAGGFTIEALEAPQVRVEIVGPTAFRAGHPTPFDLVLENAGNVDAVALPVWVTGLPSDATVSLDFALAYPPQGAGEPDWSTVPLGFESPGGRYVPLVIPRLPPGTLVRRIHLTVPSDRTFTLGAAVSPPWVDGSLFRSCLSGAGVITNPSCMGAQLTGIAAYLAANPQLEAMSGVGVWAKVAWQCEGAGTLPAALAQAEQVLDHLVQSVEQGTAAPGCGDVLLPRWRQVLAVAVGSSFDPNDKIGPAGTVSRTQAIPYSVRFENLSSATAATQRVIVTDMLEVNLDLSTVSLGPIAFGSVRLVPPPGLKQYAQDVDLGVSRGLIVRVQAGPPDPLTRQLVWSFTSLDRVTGQPLNPSSLDGFLPPNQAPPEGEGSVLFTVRPTSTASGTIQNSATIDFDGNALTTAPVVNALDGEAPASHVLPLASPTTLTHFAVQWEAPGSPADLRDYTIYVAEDGGPYRAWRQNTVATGDTFAVLMDGQAHVYAFYSVARDESGNVEAAPPVPDAQTLYTTAVGDLLPWRLGLEGARPNPARGALEVWFTLEGHEPATLELIDVAGRRVERRAVGALGPGRHRLTLAPRGPLASGLYFLRLTQGDRGLHARVALLR